MKPAYTVPAETIERQARAADPSSSAWVSANAGSGKTHVLARRVIRLLLEGTDPSKVLCLTYTRAAAANMSNRVFRDLAAWTQLDDEALAAALLDLDGRRPSRDRLKRARQLFARALETPGGLKIQTIHAFCESVLHQFPLEANIAAHFELLDPAMEEALFVEARRELLTGLAAEGKPWLTQAFATVLAAAGETGLEDLLGEIVRKRDALRAFIERIGEGDARFPLLYQEFGFRPDEDAAEVAAAAWPLPGFDPDYFARMVAAATAADARTVLTSIVPDASLAFAETDPVRRLALLAKGFLTGKGEPYSDKAFRKALLDRMPDLLQRYAGAAAVIAAVRDRLALLRMIEGTVAALAIADWLVGRYEQLKAGRGFLDFNDLIGRTLRLLARQDAGAWVQYKLDKGIDHILLDEAQDTSPEQWAVVKHLAEEFFTGAGARDGVLRTVFAVGDEKQSIYSFQGAAPESFDRSRLEFKARVAAVRSGFEDLKLTWSFRSTADVLEAVDAVFAASEVRRGVSSDADPLSHKAIREGAAGYVELWPSIGDQSISEPDDWTEPVDHAGAPAVKLAERIAACIHGWLERREVLEGQGRRLRAGDIMVLVRKRDRFVHALSRSLKNRRVPVAGADRLSLPAHIAVKDLAALGRFLLQPEDDLSLAAVLRSPIFGMDEDTLFRLASGRGEARSLGEAMRLAARDDPALAAISARFDRWASEAAFRPAFEFYSALLSRDGVRRAMVARLGREAGDILDEFLNFCLAQERTGQRGLEAFLATLDVSGPEIKREMDQGRDEVRIMTVHAAKGLEAPVVFLVDSGSAPFSDAHLPRLIPFETGNMGIKTKGYLWRCSADVSNAFSQGAAAVIKERADDEYRRLLYVGMTRAEDRLIVCGYHGKKAQNASTWHALVDRGLTVTGRLAERPHPAGEGTVRRFRVTTGLRPVAATAEVQDAGRPAAEPLPAGFAEPLAPWRGLPRPLAPSGASALIELSAEAAVLPLSPVLDPEREPSFAVRRGQVVHKLLQVLPTLAEGTRRDAALRYVGRAGADWPQAERQGVLESVEAVMGDPRFAPLFANGSRAEVAIMGKLTVRGAVRAVSGVIDRLAVGESGVRIVDYKTNRPAPASLAEVAPGYVLQLALYRALLAPLYPGRAVAASLLFTEVPRMIEVPADAMDAALAALLGP